MTTIAKSFIPDLDRESELAKYFPSTDITSTTESSDFYCSHTWYKPMLDFGEKEDIGDSATSLANITKVMDEQTLSNLGLSHSTFDVIQTSITTVTKDFPKLLTDDIITTTSQPMTLADFFHKVPPSILDKTSSHPANLGEMKSWKTLETPSPHKVNSEALSLVDNSIFKHIDGLNTHPVLEVDQLTPII